MDMEVLPMMSLWRFEGLTGFEVCTTPGRITFETMIRGSD